MWKKDEGYEKLLTAMKKIFTNPIAIAVALLHWVIVLLAMYSEHERSNLIGEFNQSLLVMFLIGINLPAILLATFFNKLLTFVGISTFNSNIGDYFAIIFISLQWLLIGNFMAYISGEIKPTKFKLSLIDE